MMNDNLLIERAKSNRRMAYAPYSEYLVGVALLAESGKAYDGANMENCIHRCTHAERVAIDQAVFHGERRFSVIAVVTDSPEPAFPCGQCLQDLTEFDDGKGNLKIIAANLEGVVRESLLKELLPVRFGPANLGVDNSQTG